MSYVRVWIHAVWSTKNRTPILKKEIRTKVFRHIEENAEANGIHIDCINGYEEHVHCLFSLGGGQAISSCIQMFKGESSRWINRQELFDKKFKWQRKYYAVSVGESTLQSVRKYIYNQEEHHQNESFEQEFKELMTIEQFMKFWD